jgi:protein-tyrosine phosphatase
MSDTNRGFVDVHSHTVPSLDDGARSIEEAVELCRLAVESGTGILYATPHVHAAWDSYPWSRKRARTFAKTFPVVRERALGLDLRRGAEVYPSEMLVADPSGFVLEGTEAVLIEFPGSWVQIDDPIALVAKACGAASAAGLAPVLAHPERCRAVAKHPEVVTRLVDSGALLCLNGPSVFGGHGETAERVSWELLELGLVALVASDGHRGVRTPTLERAYRAVAARLGAERALPLFTGAALPWVASPSSHTTGL